MGRFSSRAKKRPTLWVIAHLERGLTGRDLEAGKASSTTTCHTAIFRSYFSLRGVRSISSQQEKSGYLHGRTLVKPPVPDSNRFRFFFSFDKFVNFSHLWPSSWRMSLSGSQHVDGFQEFLNLARSRTNRLQPTINRDQGSLPSFPRRNYKNGDKSSVLDAGMKYNVIRIDSDGKLQPLVLKSAELGLHPRDLDLLSNSTFIPQRATISVQRDKCCRHLYSSYENSRVLVRMENVRAIICKDHVLLLDARDPRAREAFADSLAKQAKENPLDSIDQMPFHLRMMESLLEETSNYFHQKVDRLKLVVEKMLQELTDDVSLGGLQRLLPLRRAITEIEHDVRDAHQAMDQVLRSDEILQAFCLVSDGSGLASSVLHDPEEAREREQQIYKLRGAAADMLLTYQREVDDAGCVLEELRKGIEAAQEVWELGLDTARNRIIRMNLYISVSTCSLAVATLPAAFFGMNLPSGYEEHPTLFYWVVGAASTAPVAFLLGLVLAFHVWPKIVDKRRAQDLAGLVDLLRHLDSVDDVMKSVAREAAGKAITSKEFQGMLRSHPSSQLMQQYMHFPQGMRTPAAGKAITSKEFQGMLRSHPSAQLMQQKELDLLFRIYDRDRNGVLEAEERKTQSSRVKGPSSDRGDKG